MERKKERRGEERRRRGREEREKGRGKRGGDRKDERERGKNIHPSTSVISEVWDGPLRHSYQFLCEPDTRAIVEEGKREGKEDKHEDEYGNNT